LSDFSDSQAAEWLAVRVSDPGVDLRYIDWLSLVWVTICHPLITLQPLEIIRKIAPANLAFFDKGDIIGLISSQFGSR
jgi:hypothetical protein